VVKPKVVKALFKSAVRFGGGGWGKNSGRIGVNIPAALCSPKLREEFFINATLRVLISLDPKTDTQPAIPGLDDEYPSVEITVKVNRYSTNATDISFSMTFDSASMDAAFLKTISHAAGSLYILKVTANEDGSAMAADEDAGDDEDSGDDE